MKTTGQADVDDLDYLNDILPYRCPKCGDDRKFSSLSDLRLHLEKNHSYQIGYVRPHSRTQVFDAKSVKTKENMSSAVSEGGKMFKDSTEEKSITSSDGRSSPLLLSFKEDARILERRLQAAKEAEMRNKVRPKHGKVEKMDDMGAMNDLHQKLMSSRSRQWQAEESLYQIDSVLENLEKSVERRFQDQHGVISGLVSNLDNREEQLSQANATLHSLQRERQKLIIETQEILQQSEIKNERLQLELERRDNVLHSVQAQLQDLRAKTGESIRQRDSELLVTRDRVHHLELEKESLMRDVEELLMVSDKDNLTLKQTLGAKERQLKLVNNELLKIRNEQSDLLNESVKLYEAAETGNQKLKKVIEFKDNKLEQAETELFRLRKMQEDLVSESQLLTNQADHHSQTMRKILGEKEAALSSLREELAKVTEERDRLLQEPVKSQGRGQVKGQDRGQATDRAAESNSQNQVLTPTPDIQREAENQREVTPIPHPRNAELSKLQTGLKEKQAALEEREKELESLKQFIDTTAKKEIVARTRLEEFINELIDRADRAERELDQMKKTARHSNDLPDGNVHNARRYQQRQSSEIPPSSSVLVDRTRGSSTLHSAMVRHLVEATVEPWQNSIPTSVVMATKEKLPPKEEGEDTCTGSIKPGIRRNSRNSDRRNKSRQRRELKLHSVSQRQSSNDTEVMSPDEDSLEYSPLPNAKSLDKRKEFQRTDSNQSQRHGWMDPDSILYSEVMDDSELEKFSIDSFNKLPNELHPISGSHPNVVYVPFNRTTGQPIKIEAQQEVQSGINSQTNIVCENPTNPSTPEQLNGEPNGDITSSKSSTSQAEFKEIPTRQMLNSQQGKSDVSPGEKTSVDGDRHSTKSTQFRNRPQRREDLEGKATMRSVGVMASIPSFQGTSTESESCEEMSMAENSLSDVNSISDNHSEEKQEDAFEREVDENGIIWDMDDNSHHSLLESRRFSPYGSEMKSSSSQGGALLDESDSLDDIPVRDPSRRNDGYDSEELEGLGLSSASFRTYPPVKKQVNFQTLSGHSDPIHYNVYKRSNNHKVKQKRRGGYEILSNDTDDDDYEVDIRRWRTFTADINTDLQRNRSGSPSNRLSAGFGTSPSAGIRTSPSARLNTAALSRQNYPWQSGGHSSYSPHSVFAFGEPPFRTMSSPGLHRNFHSPVSSWRPQRERFIGSRFNIGKSSSLSNLNLRASSVADLSLKSAYCKDSSTQTWLLDRRVTEKDLHYMEEISSSVNHSEKLARNSHSDSRTDSVNQKSDTRSSASDSTLKSSSKRSFMIDRNSLSGGVDKAREGQGHHSWSREGQGHHSWSREGQGHHSWSREGQGHHSWSSGKAREGQGHHSWSREGQGHHSWSREGQGHHSWSREGQGHHSWSSGKAREGQGHHSWSREGQGHHSWSSGKSDRRNGNRYKDPQLYSSFSNGSKSKSISENSYSTHNASESMHSESHKSACTPKPESPHCRDTGSECQSVGTPKLESPHSRDTGSESHMCTPKLESLAGSESCQSVGTPKPESSHSRELESGKHGSKSQSKDNLEGDERQLSVISSISEGKPELLAGRDTTHSDNTQKNSPSVSDEQKYTGTRQSAGAVTEDEFSNQSVNSNSVNHESGQKLTKMSNSDTGHSKQQPEISKNLEQKLLFSNYDESMKDDTSLDLSKSSHSEHDSKSGHNLAPNLGTCSVLDKESSENCSRQCASPTSAMNMSKSEGNEINDSRIKQGSSIDTETFYDPEAISVSQKTRVSGDLSVSQKTRVSGDLGVDAEDASLTTDLSINSNLGDISNQSESSNFSNFFNNSELEGQTAEKTKDPDKDKDCHEESAEILPFAASGKQVYSGTSEGQPVEMLGDGNSPGIDTQHTVSPSADFQPFSLAFRETSELPVFSEAQETEDEEDLSTLDSCSVTLSSSGETKVLPSRREETRKRRQALRSIFHFLDIDSLLAVAQVCREWKKVSRNRSLWKRVVLENRKCSSKFLVSLSHWCTAMTHLTLRNLSPRDQWQTEADDVYQSTIRGSLEPGLERLLQVTESTLRSVSIISCGTLLTDKSVWLASSYSRMLCTVDYLSSSFPLGPDVMYALGAGCRDITTLKIHPMFPCENEEKFSNKCLQIVSQFCCDLETLSIGGTKIDINGLVLIAKGCQRLRELELHYCQEVTSDVSVAVCRLGLKQLLSLSFVHTPVTADALKHFYNTCKHLKCVHVALSVKDFHQGKAEKEQAKLKKWQKFVKDMKGLQKKPGLGNILKLNLQDT